MALGHFEKIEGAVAVQDSATRKAFIAKVYNWLAGALAVMVGFGYLSFKYIQPGPGLYNLFLFGPLGIVIVALFTSKKKGLNAVLFMAFALLEGGMLGLIAKSYAAAGSMAIFGQAAVLTIVVFGGLTAYVHISKKDFSFLGGFLFVGLFLLIGAGIASMFISSSALNLAYSVGGVGIFSLYILYDTSRIIHRAKDDEAVFAAWMLLLDIVNLFLFILRLIDR